MCMCMCMCVCMYVCMYVLLLSDGFHVGSVGTRGTIQQYDVFVLSLKAQRIAWQRITKSDARALTHPRRRTFVRGIILYSTYRY